MSGSLGFGATDIDALDLRLIAPDRPGLGSSDPHPGKTLTTWVDDIAQVIAEHDLQGAAAVGFSQGAPFALALAAHRLVTGVAVVSGQDELAHPPLAPLLHPDVAKMITAVQRDAEAFEEQLSALATADGLWQLIIGMSGDHDRKVYMNEAFSAACRRSLREGFSQGAQGYARDLVTALRPWPIELAEVVVPVDIWYGGLDASTVHSPDFGATLAARLPNVSRTVDPAQGGSILWTRAGEILSRLRFPLLSALTQSEGNGTDA
jgi:pimeloyl-ACP methyl ester carboxylesterase